MFNSAERVPMTVGDIREPMQAATFSPNIKISDSCCISATRKETTSSAISKSSILSTSQAHLRRLKLKYISPPFNRGVEVEEGEAIPSNLIDDKRCLTKRGLPPVFR